MTNPKNVDKRKNKRQNRTKDNSYIGYNKKSLLRIRQVSSFSGRISVRAGGDDIFVQFFDLFAEICRQTNKKDTKKEPNKMINRS